MRSELVYAPDGTVTGMRHAWTFDDMFSAFATQGIDSKKRGEFTREELEPLAKVNVESLKDFEYFTIAKVNGKKVEFIDPPKDYYLEYKDEMLTLHFALPLKSAGQGAGPRDRDLRPSYFVDFAFEKDTGQARRRAGGMQARGRAAGGDGCRAGAAAVPARRPTRSAIRRSSAPNSPTDLREMPVTPAGARTLAAACDRRAVVAASLVAAGALELRWRRAAVRRRPPKGAPPAPPPPAWSAGSWSSRPNSTKASPARSAPPRPTAARSGGCSGCHFVYGIFHAAGPGHGKAVISSYVVANEETWWRGVVLSFASALLQAPVAVAVVGIAAALLNATAATMKSAVDGSRSSVTR